MDIGRYGNLYEAFFKSSKNQEYLIGGGLSPLWGTDNMQS